MLRAVVFAGLVLSAALLATSSPSAGAPSNGAQLEDAAAGSLRLTERARCRPYARHHSWGWGTGCAPRHYLSRVGAVIVSPHHLHYCVRRCGPYSCQTYCY